MIYIYFHNILFIYLNVISLIGDNEILLGGWSWRLSLVVGQSWWFDQLDRPHLYIKQLILLLPPETHQCCCLQIEPSTHEPLAEAGICEKLIEHMYFLEHFQEHNQTPENNFQNMFWNATRHLKRFQIGRAHV